MISENYRLILIEDEQNSAASYEKWLRATDRVVEVKTAATIDKAEQLIRNYTADGLLMDIKIIGGDTLHLIESLHTARVYIPPTIVFTAYNDEYDHQEIINSVAPKLIRYQPKPLIQEHFIEFIETFDNYYLNNKTEIPAVNVLTNKYSFRTNDIINFINVGDIVYIDYNGGNTCTFYTSTRNYVQRCSLSYLDKLFKNKGFVQVSKDKIVNLQKVLSINCTEREIELDYIKQNGRNISIEIGERYYQDILKAISIK